MQLRLKQIQMALRLMIVNVPEAQEEARRNDVETETSQKYMPKSIVYHHMKYRLKAFQTILSYAERFIPRVHCLIVMNNVITV